MDFRKALDEKLIPLMSEMIRNECVNYGTPDSGNETRSADTLKRFFDEYGIKSEILSVHPDRGNLLVRIPGTDPEAPSLMYMGHMDVVPANPDDWSVDPFGGVVQGGYMWGRGAVDMLNMTSAAAVAFAERISRNGPSKGDLIFLAVADEEATGRMGARWLVENHWDKVGTDYMVTELGGFFISRKKGRGITVTIGEKGVAWVRITVKGIAGHGSMPLNADNAVLKISEVTRAIGAMKPKTVFTNQYREMMKGMLDSGVARFLAGHRLTLGLALRNVFRNNEGIAKFLHTASRMTISPDAIQSGNKVNIIADRGILDLDVRLLIDQSIEDVLQSLNKVLTSLRIEADIDVLEFFPSTVSETDSPLMTATKRVVGTSYPDADFIPLYIGGATDGRFWRQRGSVVYGFAQFGEEMTMDMYTSMLHGKDERISLTSLQKSLEYFYRLPDEFYSI